MKLVMTGHNTAPVHFVTAKEIRNAGGISKGYFSRYSEWKVENGKLIVKFTLKILVDKDLDAKTRQDVLAHERQHFADFKGHASKLYAGLTKALAAGRDPDIDARIEWFNYDLCVQAAAFHRRSAGYSVEICSKPSSSRPQ